MGMLLSIRIALIASAISTLGWLVALGGIVYVPYLALTGGRWTLGVGVMLAGIVIGIIFAKIEGKYRLFDVSFFD